LLRWQKRLAAAEAVGRREGFPLATAVYNEGAKSAQDAFGFLPPQGLGSESSAVLGPVPKAMRRLGAALASKQVTVLDVVGDERRSVARYNIRASASLPPLDDRTRTEIRQLLVKLLHLGDSGTPLTLEGAAALAAADQGTFYQVGGVVENAQVAPLISRFATLKESDSLLLALSPLPEEPLSLDLRTQIVVQFRVQPAWVQHELLFLELP
jgi:hypothetical protein